MTKEIYHKTDLDNLSEIKKRIAQALGKTDFLHIQSLNQELSYLNRGQLLCALDAMEREETIVIRKSGKDLYIELSR